MPSDCTERKWGAGCRAESRGWQMRGTQGTLSLKAKRGPPQRRKTLKCYRLQEDEEVSCFQDHAVAGELGDTHARREGRQKWDWNGLRNGGQPVKQSFEKSGLRETR